MCPRGGIWAIWGVIRDIKGLWLASKKRENTGIPSACPWHHGRFLGRKWLDELFGLVSEGCARGRRGTFFIVEKQFGNMGCVL